jgi:hypothetical protein
LRAEDRYRLRQAQQAPSPSFWTVLGAELRRSMGKPHFWLSLVRNSIPLFGAFLWDWDVLAMAFYFLLQSWLMGSLYCALDLVFNPKDGKPPQDLLDALNPLLKQFLGAAVIFAVIVGLFGGFVLFGFFDKSELTEFFDGGWRHANFLTGVLALVVGCIAEATRFLRSLPTRTPADIEADNFRFAATVHTVAVLCAISGFFGALARFTFGSTGFVIPAVLVVTLFDVAPRSAALMMGRAGDRVVE